MTKKERQRQILQLLREKQTITVENACDHLNASPATIRRDFNELSSQGLAGKYWGGITTQNSNNYNQMTHFLDRQTKNFEEKKRIGAYAASLVQEGDIVIIDGGTTTLCMASFLADKRIKIITNSILIAHQIDRERKSAVGAELFLTGGMVYPRSGLMIGPMANESLRNYYADIAFLSAAGINSEIVSNSNQMVVETEKTILKQSKKNVLLVDSSKFGKISLNRMCLVNELNMIISDNQLDQEWVSNVRHKGVKIEKV